MSVCFYCVVVVAAAAAAAAAGDGDVQSPSLVTSHVSCFSPESKRETHSLNLFINSLYRR